MIRPEIRDLFSKAGISHLLAISGLHLSIVTFIFYGLFYRIFYGLYLCRPTFFKQGFISGRIKKSAGLLTLFPVLLYVVFTGGSPSVLRAFIMTLVFMVSIVREKETDTFSSLCTAGALILFLDSSALFSISFQLSFAAVYFIILGHSVIKDRLFHLKSKLMSRFMLMFFVTVFAGMGTAPLAAYYFHIVSFSQWFTNLFAIPIIGFVVLPLGFVLLFTHAILPKVFALILWVCHGLVIGIIQSAVRLTQFDFAWGIVALFPVLAVIGYYLCLNGIFFWFKKYKKIAAGLVIGGCLCVFVVVNPHLGEENKNKGIETTVLDVGQGFCAFVQLPDRTRVLIDGGGFSDRSSFDPGRNIIAPFLWYHNIKTLDFVILTHPESDHLKGLVYILKYFKVKTLMKNSDTNNSKAYQTLVDICKKKDIPIVIPQAYPNEYRMGQTRLTFFDAAKGMKNLNNNSLVFKFQFKDISLLFTGDIMKERERQLARTYKKDLHTLIMIAPHHGSSTSSTKFFLDKVGPESVIIPCGWSNRYGFPHHQVLKRYQDKSIRIYRTDRDGAVTMVSGGINYQITVFED